jgi:hypothetical protein
MGLEREIEALRRRVRRVAKVENPPQLSVHVFNEGEKNPTGDSPWELSIMIEKKRPLIDQANSLDASRFSRSSTSRYNESVFKDE